ncbi:MAG TPA: ligase-associated DNA damage response DEXH box helicase [Gemmatimonadaceae bacterium]|nr:ligase-associated DNA damage response DEXH box helicase [Gemmatimonadaceae bacterium]
MNIARVDAWFAARGWSPFAFQREVWRAYLDGESGLVHAATGTGKTLAAWLGPIIASHEEGAPTGPQVLWITPLRALAADTEAALRDTLADLAPSWTVERRTGDTSSATRARQRTRLPTALITTPESASLLLSYEDSARAFLSLRLVVVDEWHELFGTKRGVQTELVLSRLRASQPALRTWGLSATLGNIAEAAATLGGVHTRMRIVRGVEPKRVAIDALVPPTVERFPWAGHLGMSMVPAVVEAIDAARTTLVFTNTRSQCERWYHALLEARPDWAGVIALHHGSLDRHQREWVEHALRDGRVRCVVATSTLDLGVDFAPVERVLHIGSPKGVGRLMQRAGRSGHCPGAESRVTCVPTHALELVEAAAARDGVNAGTIEPRRTLEPPLDVLVQHVVTIAAGSGFEAAALLDEVRGTATYADLENVEWRWLLDFVGRGGAALTQYPEYARVTLRHGRYVVGDAAIARRHRQAIGTILSDAQMRVQFLRGDPLGSVEESFIARLRPGDHFTFGGRALTLVRVRDLTAWVRLAPTRQAVVPKWQGTRLPLSDTLGAALRARLAEARDGMFRGPEMEAVRPVLDVQARWSRIPGADELLIEQVASREGHHLFVFPFDGRVVHEGLAALIAYRLARLAPITFTMAANDYGFELLSQTEAPLAEGLANDLFGARGLLEDLLAALNASEMARRQFREIARVSGLVFPGLPRAGKTARQLQASSGLFYDVLQRYDPDNLLLAQARREVLERQLDSARLRETLHRLSQASIVVTRPRRTPPLAFPLLVDRTRARVSSETLTDRIRRMQLVLERAAG